MFSKRDIENKINLEYSNKRISAQQIADQNLLNARKNKAFDDGYKRIKELNFIIAKKEFEKKDVSKEKGELKSLSQKQKDLLKTLKIPISALSPIYECKKCNDSGYYDNHKCECYKKRLSEEILTESGINIKELKTLQDFDENICTKKDKEHFELLKFSKKLIQTFVEKYPNDLKKINNFIYGPTGVGKTFILECLATELVKKGFYVNYVTAFQLNNIYLQYNSSFSSDKYRLLDPLLDPDVLLIDDLGSEPIFNTTCQYLYLVLSERALKNKPTWISSNCTPSDMFKLYGERVFSRLFNKKYTNALEIKGLDLRIFNSKNESDETNKIADKILETDKTKTKDNK